MSKVKRLFGAFLMMGVVVLSVTTNLQGESKRTVAGYEPVEADKCSFDTVSDYIDKYLVSLEKKAPSLVPFNEDFSYTYVVTAKDKIKKVVVVDQIPSGAKYISSSPAVQVEDDVVTWTLYNMEKGESISIELTLNASTITDFTSSATIDAYPEASTTTAVGVPVLSINKTTPSESVLIGSDVPWNLTLVNSGTVCARDVVITDSFTQGLADASGNNEQLIEIGTLVPGERREINVTTKAIKSGKFCSTVVATGSNVELVEDEFCFVVLDKGIEISQKGPEKQFVGKKATYTTTVINTGDVPFANVVLTNTAPTGSKILAAKDATINGNIATWIIDMAAGEEKNFEVDLLVTKGGSYCNKVTVLTADSDLSSSASACTEWSGYPALLVEVIDTQDPLVVGDETTYIIQIANQGSAADTNVKLDIEIPDGLSIISVTGDTKSTVTGNSISFEPYPVLKAKEIIQFRVVAKATKIGDMRFKAEMRSDLLTLPVPEQESTQVY